jgi:hypothetical protein
VVWRCEGVARRSRTGLGSHHESQRSADAPRRATLLNTGQHVAFAVDMTPSDHIEHKPYLRLRNLPVDELADTVLVVKLEFDA